MKRRAFLLLIGSTLLLTGCLPFLYDDRCGPEFRETIVQGTLRSTDGAAMGRAELILAETRGDTLTRGLVLALMGTAYGEPGPLSGHVTHVRLLADDAVVHEFTFRPGNQHEIVMVDPSMLNEAPFETLKAHALAGDLVLELESTLPGHARVLTPLVLQFAGKWDRAHCS